MSLVSDVRGIAKKLNSWLDELQKPASQPDDTLEILQLVFDETKAVIDATQKTYESNDDKAFKLLGGIITLSVGGLYLGKYLYSFVDYKTLTIAASRVSMAMIADYGLITVLLLVASERLLEAVKIREGKAYPEYRDVIKTFLSQSDQSKTYMLKLITNTNLNAIDEQRKVLDVKSRLIKQGFLILKVALCLTLLMAILMLCWIYLAIR